MAEGLDFGKQIGPMPLGMWVVVGVGGLGLGYVINRNMAKNSAAAGAQSSQQLTETGVGTGGNQFQYDPIDTEPSPTTPQNNQTWGTNATNWLIGKGIAGTVAENAIRKYLSAQPLTPQERALVDMVLSHMGAQPEPLPPVDQPDTGNNGGAPAAATALNVSRFYRWNALSWSHDGRNVTKFVVTVRNAVSGATKVTSAPAKPMPWRYTWNNFAGARSTKGYAVRYEIVPWNGNVAGPATYISATFLI